MSGFAIKARSTFTPRSDIGQFIATRVTPAVRAGVQAFAEVVFDESQALVAVDTGELKDSGKVEITETAKTIRAEVIYSAAHASYVEYGTGIRGASSPGAGPVPYNPTWHGMAAQPYLRPAIDTAKERGLIEMVNVMKSEMA